MLPGEVSALGSSLILRVRGRGADVLEHPHRHFDMRKQRSRRISQSEGTQGARTVGASMSRGTFLRDSAQDRSSPFLDVRAGVSMSEYSKKGGDHELGQVSFERSDEETGEVHATT